MTVAWLEIIGLYPCLVFSIRHQKNMCTRLYSYLSDRPILYDYHFGFRKCYYWPAYTYCRGRLVMLPGVCRRLSSVVVCNAPRRQHIQRNSPGAARDDGPVMARPVRATPCSTSLALIDVLDQIYHQLDNNKKYWEFS